MGPYRKIEIPYPEVDDLNWGIEDGDGIIIAQTQTETLANLVLGGLLGLYGLPPDYAVGEPVGTGEEENDGE